jgi:hypothetical protein
VLKSLHLYATTNITVTIQIVAHVLAYTNSCVNPFLYAFLSENFRKAFRKVSYFVCLINSICPISVRPTHIHIHANMVICHTGVMFAEPTRSYIGFYFFVPFVNCMLVSQVVWCFAPPALNGTSQQTKSVRIINGASNVDIL